MAFIFGGNTGMSYEDVQRKREIAASLAANLGTPRNVSEGLTAIGKALAARGMTRRADEADARNRDEFNKKWGQLFSGGSSGVSPSGVSSPAPSYTPPDPSSPQGIAADTMTALGKRSPYADAIASVESAGSGDYSAVGPDTGKGRAYGRYQVMDFNVGPWTKKHLGKEMTPQEFLNDPAAQDAVFSGEFGSYVQKYGNPQDAASMWFSGRPMAAAGNASDGYNTVPQYVEKFNAALGGPERLTQAGGMDIGTLAEVAGSPYASEGQKAIAQALLSQQMQATDPMRRLELERAQLEIDAMRNPKPKPVNEEYNLAVQQSILRGEPAPTLTEWKRGNASAGAANQTVQIGDSEGVPANDAALRKKLGEKEGEVWASYLEAGATSSGTVQDMQLMDEIITMAPQGPVTGRLANAFPGVNSAADAFNSVVKRVAPTLRAPGSGSTSDVEYDGMLKSLPQLSARPEANRAIAAMMKAKAEINVKRAEIVRSAQNDEIDIKTARRMMSELDSQSIMTPELKAILGDLAPTPESAAGSAPEGVDQELWDVMSPEERALWEN